MLTYATLDEAFGSYVKKSKKPKQENFVETAPPQTSQIVLPHSQAAVQSDMNHACRTYGVCPPGYPSATTIEPFDQQSSSCQQLTVPFRPQGQEHAATIQKQMKEVNTFMASQNNMFVGAAPLEMDDELQSYLQEAQEVAANKSVSSAATPSSLVKPEPPADGSPAAAARPTPPPVPLSMPAPVQPKPQHQPQHPIDPYRKWVELGLFVFAGILLIFLLEQIFRIGVMVGMKQTTAFLEPFIDYAQNLAAA